MNVPLSSENEPPWRQHRFWQNFTGERGTYLAISIAVFVLCVWGILRKYGTAPTLYNQYDDAYITYRYAVSFALGRGLVFNVGESTDAASSFLYTVLLAVPYRLGLHDLEKVATVIGVVSAGLVGVIVFDTGFRLTGRKLLSVACAFASVYHGFISGWATSGMETCFYSVLVVAFVARAFLLKRNDGVAVALLLAIVLTRIEGLILVGAWSVIVAGEFMAEGRAQRLRLLRFAGIVAGVMLLYYGGKYLRYGTALPHSFLFKRLSLEHQPNARAVIDDWKADGLPMLVMAACGLPRLKRDVYSMALVLFVGASAAALLRGPTSHFCRYGSHLLPVLVLMGVPALQVLLRSLPVGALGFALWAGVTTEASFNKVYRFSQSYAGHQACRKQMGQFIAANADPSQPVLSSDIGEVSYVASGVPFIDAFGLTSADMLKIFASGRSPDELLFQKRPVLVADIRAASGFKALGFLNGRHMVRRAAPSTWLGRTKVGPSLFQCTSPDGLKFAVARLETQ